VGLLSRLNDQSHRPVAARRIARKTSSSGNHYRKNPGNCLSPNAPFDEGGKRTRPGGTWGPRRRRGSAGFRRPSLHEKGPRASYEAKTDLTGGPRLAIPYKAVSTRFEEEPSRSFGDAPAVARLVPCSARNEAA